MSFNLASGETRRFVRASHSSSAFIVGALFLLVFLAASVSIFVQLFAHAANQATEGLELTRAVAAATDMAEAFAASPADVESVNLADDLVILCDVSRETSAVAAEAPGTLYRATIRVYPAGDYAQTGIVPDGEPLYEIQTACYEGGDSQ